MQSEIESIKRLKDPKYKVSCHYLIGRKGKIIQMVREKNIGSIKNYQMITKINTEKKKLNQYLLRIYLHLRYYKKT